MGWIEIFQIKIRPKMGIQRWDPKMASSGRMELVFVRLEDQMGLGPEWSYRRSRFGNSMTQPWREQQEQQQVPVILEQSID